MTNTFPAEKLSPVAPIGLAIAREWSGQQTAIFDWFENGEGNLVVRARAGTGKTTTILEAITYAPEQTILLAAFNKKIAEELKSKLKNPRAEAKTLHSLGFGFVLRNWNGVTPRQRPRRAPRAEGRRQHRPRQDRRHREEARRPRQERGPVPHPGRRW
jgi:hypothetical protein